MATSASYTRIVEVYDTLVVDDVYEEWTEFVVDAWQGGGAAVSRVLDVGCGTGLLAEQLIARGLQVVGIDASESMLASARERLGNSVELVLSPLPALSVDGPFDAAVSTFDTLNYLAPADLQPSFAAIANVLRDGAVLVFDIHTDAMMHLAIEHPVVSGEQSGWRYRVDTSVDLVNRTCVSSLAASAVDGSSTFTEHHTQHFHQHDEVEQALVAAGFSVLAVTDEYTAAPLTEATLRGTWTARRLG